MFYLVRILGGYLGGVKRGESERLTGDGAAC